MDVVHRRDHASGAAAGRRARKAVFGIAEQRLGRREWVLRRYSIADIHLFRLFWRFAARSHATPGTFPG